MPFCEKACPPHSETLIVLVVEVDRYNTIYTSLNHQSNQKSSHSHRQKSETHRAQTCKHAHTHYINGYASLNIIDNNITPV